MNRRAPAGVLTIAVVRGIPLRVHWSFLLLLVWVALGERSGAVASVIEIVFVLAVFVCVLLHELGHALTARKFGIGTRDITLYPVGGVAMLERDASPRAELAIALAGPLVNVILAALLYPFIELAWFVVPEEGREATLPVLSFAQSFLRDLFAANVMLAIFNLIPAIPMDGGRVLRAVLALAGVGNPTGIATGISQVLSILMGLGAIALGNPLLLIISIMVFLAAMQERARARTQTAALGMRVRDAMSSAENLQTFIHGTTLSQAVSVALRSFQPVFPVLHAGSVIGVIERDALLQAGVQELDDMYLSTIMDRQFATVPADEPIYRLINRMATEHLTSFVVLEGERFVGILTESQLLEFLLIRGMRQQHEQLRRMIEGHNEL